MNTKVTTNDNTAHTPGPWHINGVGSPTAQINSDIRVWSVNGSSVCEIHAHRSFGSQLDIPSKEEYVNAKLIAAAPELLEALCNLINAMDSDHIIMKSKPGKDCMALEKLMVKALQAVSKATT